MSLRAATFEKPYILKKVRHSSARWRRIQRMLKRLEAIVEHAARIDGYARGKVGLSMEQLEEEEERRLRMYRGIDNLIDRLAATVDQEISVISQERLATDLQAKQRIEARRIRHNSGRRMRYQEKVSGPTEVRPRRAEG